MKTMRMILFAAVLFAAPALFAQVVINMNVSQKFYMQYEPVFVRMSVRNLSAHPLAFGESEGLRGSIRFIISSVGTQNREFALLIDKNKLPDLKGTIIPPGGTRNFTFMLSKFYDLRRLGKYTVKAVISHPQLTSAYESEPSYFSVIRGTEVWKTTAGIPNLTGTDKMQKVKTRNYHIYQYFTGRYTVYMLCIDDPERVYLLKRIGFDLGNDLAPQCEVDFLSRINILIAASPKVFAYYQYDHDGKLEKKKVYIKTSTTPKLSYDAEQGTVYPVGGREAIKEQDYEEIKDLPFTESMDEAKSSVFGDETDDLPNPEKSSGKKKTTDETFDDVKKPAGI